MAREPLHLRHSLALSFAARSSSVGWKNGVVRCAARMASNRRMLMSDRSNSNSSTGRPSLFIPAGFRLNVLILCAISGVGGTDLALKQLPHAVDHSGDQKQRLVQQRLHR